MPIEMPRNVEAARPIARTASLRNVQQRQGSFKVSAAPYDAVVIDVNIEEAKSHADGDSLTIHVPFSLAVTSSAEEDLKTPDIAANDGPCFEVEALFVLSYSVPDLESQPEEAVKAFGMANAVFNAWPYWREFVHSSARRADYPSIVVPVLRIEDGRLVMGDER